MTKREAKGAVLRMLLPDGEITAGYIDKLLCDLEERHDNHARREAEVARDDRVTEGFNTPLDVACNRQGALVGMLRHRAAEADAVLFARSDDDTRAGLLWLMGAELGLWRAEAEVIAITREQCGLDVPTAEAGPMAKQSPDTLEEADHSDCLLKSVREAIAAVDWRAILRAALGDAAAARGAGDKPQERESLLVAEKVLLAAKAGIINLEPRETCH